MTFLAFLAIYKCSLGMVEIRLGNVRWNKVRLSKVRLG